MIDGVGMHRFDERQIINALCRMRQQFADPPSALAMLIEFEFTGGHGQSLLPAGHGSDSLPRIDLQVLVKVLFQRKHIVPGIDLGGSRWCAIDNGFGGRGEMRKPGVAGSFGRRQSAG